jgi:hypothetical protein
MTTSLVRVAAALAVPLLAFSACSSGSSDSSADSDAGSSSAGSAQAPEPAAGVVDGAAADSGAADSADSADSKAGGGGSSVEQQSIISTGSVSLEAADVARARTDVRGVADVYGGQVSEDETTTADDKRMGYARLVLRVPARSFQQAMDKLEKVATLVDSHTSSTDVSTQVIDVDERVEAARASIDRIRLLLSRAEKIGEVMDIESQLSRREADLNSLLRQQAHLADQTALSTISVTIDRPAGGAITKAAAHHTGFTAGLSAGWDALRGFGTGVATVLGAVLPWTPVALLLGIPVWLVVRRSRRTPDLLNADTPGTGA